MNQSTVVMLKDRPISHLYKTWFIKGQPQKILDGVNQQTKRKSWCGVQLHLLLKNLLYQSLSPPIYCSHPRSALLEHVLSFSSSSPRINAASPLSSSMRALLVLFVSSSSSLLLPSEMIGPKQLFHPLFLLHLPSPPPLVSHHSHCVTQRRPGGKPDRR